MFKDLVKLNRSYRKFDESYKISDEILMEFIDTARFTPSSVNLQPFKFIYCNSSEINCKVFSLTAWAKLLKEYDGPKDGERPAAYIIVCTDKNIVPNYEKSAVDVGIVSQTILLAAAEKGLGGCMIGNYSKSKLSETLSLPDNLYPALILALGKPDEEIILEEFNGSGHPYYYRDGQFIHHVPKRTLSDVAMKIEN